MLYLTALLLLLPSPSSAQSPSSSSAARCGGYGVGDPICQAPQKQNAAPTSAASGGYGVGDPVSPTNCGAWGGACPSGQGNHTSMQPQWADENGQPIPTSHTGWGGSEYGQSSGGPADTGESYGVSAATGQPSGKDQSRAPAAAAMNDTHATAKDPVEICPGVKAANDFSANASGALQSCLDALKPGGTLALPRGTYRLDFPLILNRAQVTITTKGLQGSNEQCRDDDAKCAVLKAAPGLETAALFTSTHEAHSFVIDHVNFDGNRAQRKATAEDCTVRATGRNVSLPNVSDSVIRYSGFFRALCGAAVGTAAIPSRNVTYANNVFSDNGDNTTAGLWADGLTIGFISDSRIIDNYFYNNSDVSLILGGGANTEVSGNRFVQNWQRQFAALMLTNWTVLSEKQEWADFRGLTMTNNNIDCGDYCDIGIQLGVFPWVGKADKGLARAMGASVSGNTVSTYRQAINVAGAGTPEFPLTLGKNTVPTLHGSRKNGGLSKSVPASALNIQAPGNDSFVKGEVQGASDHKWDNAF